SIRDRRNSQRPLSAVGFRDLHRPHWRRKVAPGRHPIPDSVKVLLQAPFKLLDRLPIQACRPVIALYPYIGFPDFPSGNTKRFCFILQAPPLSGWPNRCRLTTHTPFAPSAFTDFIATTECSVPWRRFRTLALVVHATRGFSVIIGAEGSHVPNNRLTRAQATYMPDTVPPVNRYRRNCSRSLLTNHGFDIVWTLLDMRNGDS